MHIETDLTNHQIFFFTPTPNTYARRHDADSTHIYNLVDPCQPRRRNEAYDAPSDPTQAIQALANPARRDIIRMGDLVQNWMIRIGRRHVDNARSNIRENPKTSQIAA